jgi:hypothetical protein
MIYLIIILCLVIFGLGIGIGMVLEINRGIKRDINRIDESLTLIDDESTTD